MDSTSSKADHVFGILNSHGFALLTRIYTLPSNALHPSGWDSYISCVYSPGLLAIILRRISFAAGTYIDDNELAPMKGENLAIGQDVIFGGPFLVSKMAI